MIKIFPSTTIIIIPPHPSLEKLCSLHQVQSPVFLVSFGKCSAVGLSLRIQAWILIVLKPTGLDLDTMHEQKHTTSYAGGG